MLRHNVGMSLDVVLNRTQLLEGEEKTLRKELDSLRLIAQDDSLSFAALIFRKERQYGTAVLELTKVERKLEDLKRYTDAPAPKSYIISPAILREARWFTFLGSRSVGCSHCWNSHISLAF